jgi:ankyrin repeat protein
VSKTALIASIQRLDGGAIQRILAAESSLVAAIDRQRRNLLQLACSVSPDSVGATDAAQVRAVEFLLDLGFDIDEPVGPDQCTALFFAVARARNPSLVRLLIARGAKPAAAPGGGLFAAGWWDDVRSLDVLIDAGAPVDIVVGVTPFLASWCWKKFEAAKFLARKGADVNFRDRKGKTALHHGVEREFDPRLLKWLLTHGASPDVEDNDGVTPRVKASRKRDKRFAAVFS